MLENLPVAEPQALIKAFRKWARLQGEDACVGPLNWPLVKANYIPVHTVILHFSEETVTVMSHTLKKSAESTDRIKRHEL